MNQQNQARSPRADLFLKRHMDSAQAEKKSSGTLLGEHPTASVPSEKEVPVTKENTGSDFPPGMACQVQFF